MRPCRPAPTPTGSRRFTACPRRTPPRGGQRLAAEMAWRLERQDQRPPGAQAAGMVCAGEIALHAAGTRVQQDWHLVREFVATHRSPVPPGVKEQQVVD